MSRIYLMCPTVAHVVGTTEPPCGCGLWRPRTGWQCVCCGDPVVRLAPLAVCLWFTLGSILESLQWETSIEPRFSRYPRLARARRAIRL